MRIKLECESGPRKGEQFTIKDDVVLGRKNADLSLRDQKASSQHARIYFDSEGLAYVEDLGSANGTKLNGSELKAPFRLSVGDTIQIGSTTLKVSELGVDSPKLAPEPQSSPSIKNIEVVQWVGTVKSLLQRVSTKGPTQPENKVQEFFPCLELEFSRGVYAGRRVLLGFGPRQIGSASGDVFIPEKVAPAVAFELIPHHNGRALYRTAHPDEVLLNNEKKKSEEVKDGDQITIGNTTISIRFRDQVP